ncbi:MAG: hypothetical protein BGO84_08995 [Dysgonomonas sp. 37-18]|nr:MAG: hypothetical protein BGO84_08995 [Dysgonomonas sp. 37-18]
MQSFQFTFFRHKRGFAIHRSSGFATPKLILSGFKILIRITFGLQIRKNVDNFRIAISNQQSVM